MLKKCLHHECFQILQNIPVQHSNPFHAIDLFIYPLKISENLWYSDVFRDYKKRPVAWDGSTENLRTTTYAATKFISVLSCSLLPVHAEVQRPHVCLQESKLLIGECFINVPITQKVVLVNTTLLTTTYDWKKVKICHIIRI